LSNQLDNAIRSKRLTRAKKSAPASNGSAECRGNGALAHALEPLDEVSVIATVTFEPDQPFYWPESPRSPPPDRPIGELSLRDVKALWDQYDGTNNPFGYEGEEIHAELNRRGEGAYCAV
jgi:hypothetical protein